MSLLDTSQLAQFTGTQGYYRIGRRHLLTDGSKYLADHAECYWMMDAIASHLCEIGTADWFVLVRVQTKDTQATMVYEDGNGLEHARQDIPYTDLPLAEVTLYACWDGQHWVIMLPRADKCQLSLYMPILKIINKCTVFCPDLDFRRGEKLLIGH